MKDRITELRALNLTLNEEAQKCFPEKGSMSPEQRKQYDELIGEIKSNQETVSRLEDAERREREMGARTAPPRDPIVSGATDYDDEADEKRSSDEKRVAARKSKEERAAFRYWAATGKNVGNLLQSRTVQQDDLPHELARFKEQRDMGIGSPTASVATSVFVPQGFVYDVDIALKAYGQLVANVRDLPTATGQPLPYPTSTDVSNLAEYVGEGAQVSDQDVTISNLTFNAYKVDTKMVKVSLELLQDSAFDLESFLKEAFAIRLARFLEAEIVNGTGSSSSHITGIISAATAGNTAAGSSTNTGGSETGGTSIGSTDLINLVAQVDPMYRPNAKFVMHDATWQKLAALLDKYGRPLFLPNPQNGKLESIYGYPIVYSQSMPQVAVNNKTVLFGDLSKYILRRVKELAVVRLVERFADYGQVAFIGFARYDGNLIDAGTHPVKYLTQAAS
ncbi:MAG TPA: phage major capsid protein [Terriglobia bacterium]|nr:phage major capsid protein [Terriglobia bacterium]